MIKSVTYTGLAPGPKFLVMGAIHGNEKCGTAGIARVTGEIDSGALRIVRGQVTFVPVANPRAYEQDKRFTERNLNRYLVPMEKPDCYEAELGNILCPMLADCDVHLAIHSYTVGGEPFVFVSPDNPREIELSLAMGYRTLMTGWEQAYAATGRKAKPADDEESTGTIEYAQRHGAVAVNIECGQHRDPEAPNVAYRSIRNALNYLGLTNEPVFEMKRVPGARLVTMTQVFYRDDAGRFAKPWKQMDAVKRGEPIAERASGAAITAPDDGFLIMPKADAPVGEEWFYFGVETRTF